MKHNVARWVVPTTRTSDQADAGSDPTPARGDNTASGVDSIAEALNIDPATLTTAIQGGARISDLVPRARAMAAYRTQGAHYDSRF